MKELFGSYLDVTFSSQEEKEDFDTPSWLNAIEKDAFRLLWSPPSVFIDLEPGLLPYLAHLKNENFERSTSKARGNGCSAQLPPIFRSKPAPKFLSLTTGERRLRTGTTVEAKLRPNREKRKSTNVP